MTLIHNTKNQSNQLLELQNYEELQNCDNQIMNEKIMSTVRYCYNVFQYCNILNGNCIGCIGLKIMNKVHAPSAMYFKLANEGVSTQLKEPIRKTFSQRKMDKTEDCVLCSLTKESTQIQITYINNSQYEIKKPQNKKNVINNKINRYQNIDKKLENFVQFIDEIYE